MFLLDVREQGRIAQVSFATRALVVAGKRLLRLSNLNLVGLPHLR